MTKKPSIALVADIRDWAFSNISAQIKKNLSTKYDFTTFYLADYGSDIARLFDELFCNSFDLVHFFWRAGVLDIYLYLRYLQSLRARHSDVYVSNFVRTPVTFSIYDHCFLEREEIEARRVVFSGLACGYTVSSQKLFKIYQEIEGYADPTMVIADGVDLEIFYPKNLKRLAETDRDIVIGWVGNSTWWNQDGIDHKGLVTLIKPAIALLRKEALPVTGKFVDRSEKFVPFAKMVDYYSSIDIYVCASDIEGTPNPVLEAMACGVPVISTDVGIVPQLFGPLQSEFILQERTADALKEKIRVLVNDPGIRRALSQENVEQIKGWTRQVESKKWDIFFDRILTRAALESGQECLTERDRNASPVPGIALKRSLFSMPVEHVGWATVVRIAKRLRRILGRVKRFLISLKVPRT